MIEANATPEMSQEQDVQTAGHAQTRPFSVAAPAPPNHHPSPQALADFLIGDCSAGTATLLGLHFEICPRCRGLIQQMGAAGAPVSVGPQGPWKAVAPGVEVAAAPSAGGIGETVYLLRVDPGAHAPLHDPIVMAEILVLDGGFDLGGSAHATGDFKIVEHSPNTWISAHPKAGLRAIVTAYQALDEV
jgi:anti-sigma factor ChrR (cupin superfamily)